MIGRITAELRIAKYVEVGATCISCGKEPFMCDKQHVLRNKKIKDLKIQEYIFFRSLIRKQN